MDIWGLTKAALRRWYILLPGILITGVLAAMVGQGIDPEYETSGAALLVQSPGEEFLGNPYAETSGPSALQIIVSSSQTRARLAASGLDGDYELTVDNRTPIFRIAVTSATAETAVATGQAVIDELAVTLQAEQLARGVPESAMATIQVLDAPDAVLTVSSSRFRTLAVIGVVGIIVSLGLAIFFDDLMMLLRRRRPSPDGDPGTDEGPRTPAQDDADGALDEPDGVPASRAPARSAQPAGTPKRVAGRPFAGSKKPARASSASGINAPRP